MNFAMLYIVMHQKEHCRSPLAYYNLEMSETSVEDTHRDAHMEKSRFSF